jgi:hypothetical protein
MNFDLLFPDYRSPGSIVQFLWSLNKSYLIDGPVTIVFQHLSFLATPDDKDEPRFHRIPITVR